MDWPTSISMVFSRQGQPSISQGEVIQKLLYHHLRNFTRIGDFTWRVSDCEELVVEVNHTTECVTDLLISICVRIVYCFTPSERNVG